MIRRTASILLPFAVALPMHAGAFSGVVLVATLRLRYQFTERFAATLKLRQFALLGSQTRDVVGSRTGETAKTDLTAGGVCLEYAF